MFKNKTLLVKTLKKIKIKLSNFSKGMNREIDENILPFQYAKTTYNFSVKKGVLETGLGFDYFKIATSPNSTEEYELNLPDGVLSAHKIYFLRHYNSTEDKQRDIIFLLGSDSKLYWSLCEGSGNYFKKVSDDRYYSKLIGIPYNIENKDCMIFSDKEKGMGIFKPGEAYTIYPNAPKVVSMCKHYERLFAIERGRQSKVVFSANLDPSCWDVSKDNAGYIDLFDERGKLLKIVSFDDYIFLFRENGITRISAYGDQNEFSVSHVYLTSDKIIGNSICVCGDRILFLTKNCLYSFDGVSTRKIHLNIESMFKNVNELSCRSSYHNGKFYIALNLDFGDEVDFGCETNPETFVNNCLLEYDFKDDELNIVRGVDIRELCVVETGGKTKLLALLNNEKSHFIAELCDNGCKVFDEQLKSVWTSSFSNLGFPNNKKIIKEIHLNSSFNCKIKVKTEKYEKIFDVKGSNSTINIRTNIVGEMFEISFISECGKAKISSPEIVMEVV